MCTKTVSQIVSTVGVAVVMTAITLSTIEHAEAAEETCENSLQHMTDPGSGKTLSITKPYFLQAPVDLNASHSSLSAARLRSQNPPSDIRYLRVNLVLVEFVETEEKAKSRVNQIKIPGAMSLVLLLADGSAMTLTSRGQDVANSPSRIDRPSELGNSTDLFRVSHAVGGMYWLDDDQVAILLEQPVTMFQITTTQGDFSVDIHPSRTDRIQFALGCLS